MARRYRCNVCQRTLIHTARCDSCESADTTALDATPEDNTVAAVAELDLIPFPGLDPQDP